MFNVWRIFCLLFFESVVALVKIKWSPCNFFIGFSLLSNITRINYYMSNTALNGFDKNLKIVGKKLPL